MAGLNVEVIIGLVDRLSGPLRGVQRQMQRLGQMGQQLTVAGAGAMAAGTGLARPLQGAAEAAINFEQAMARVGAVSRASDADLAQLTRQARQLGADTNWTASQAAEGMQFLSMAGFSTNETLQAMPGMLNLASAGAIDLGSAADIASNILSGFNIDAAEMGRLGDVLTNTFTSSNTSLSMLGETMKYVAPVADSLGISVEEVAAMAGKLGDAGIQGAQAGTALRAIMLRLASGTKPVEDALAAMNVATTDASGNMRALPAILDDINRATTHLGSGDRVALLNKLFGMEAASAGIKLLDHAGDGLNDYTETLRRAGSAAEVATKQNATTRGALNRLGSAVEDVAITIGDVMLPTITALTDKLRTVAGRVVAWTEANPELTRRIVLVTAALSGLLIVGGGLALTLGGVLGIISMAGYALGGLRIATMLITGPLRVLGWAINVAVVALRSLAAAAVTPAGALGRLAIVIKSIGAALFANPIGLFVGALVVGALLIRKYWEPLQAFFSGLWQGITEGLAPLQPAFEATWGAIGPILQPIINALGAVFGWLGQILVPVRNVGTAAEDTGRRWGQAIADMVLRIAELVNAVRAIVTQMYDAGAAIVQGLWDGLKAKWQGVTDWWADKTSWFSDIFARTNQIKSPSRVFAAMGSDLMRGLEQGINARAGMAVRQMQGIAGSMAAIPLAVSPMALQADMAASSPSASSSVSMPVTINITAPVGADANAIADHVREVMDQQRQRLSANLYDSSDNL